ncbi:TPA: hypothetical protein N0F65_004312 [Lagenidium giganteum]|uniref:Uncharacterized protein n=1 Tax=Lagenidium giganteum TaxID=4803 RepID=A0AAV2ZGG4_9STRA|nr:TPA: hypothetical protein N0F65_004312 [Lagenidium giganteum]
MAPSLQAVVTSTSTSTMAESGSSKMEPRQRRGRMVSEEDDKRRVSLATLLEAKSQSGAFARAVAEQHSDVALCRTILQKQPGKRTVDDIYILKSLLSSSKLLDFFSSLDAYRLYQSLELAVYEEKGTYVFRQGEIGDSFYLVYTGKVEIVQNTEHGDSIRQLVHLTYLYPGDSFGERALRYTSDRRAASAVIALDGTELVFLSRTVFTELLKEVQDADASSGTLEVTKRFRSNKDIIRNIFTRHSTQRSEKDLKFAVEYLKGVKFFSRFSFEVRKQLCKAMRLISAISNTIIFEEGQIGKHFYMIFTGTVEVSVRSRNRFDETTESVVSRLGEGDYFGELALSEVDGVRRATVTCSEFCELLVLGRDEYEPLIKQYQNEYHAQYAQMLRKNPYFIGPEWDDNTIEGMCSVMTEKYFPYKGEICKQGSRATEMFIVTRGECIMVHEGLHPVTKTPELYELGRFGPNCVMGCAEYVYIRKLASHSVHSRCFRRASAGKFNDIYIRDYSIVAESPVKVLVLSRFDIFHLMTAEARTSLQKSSKGRIQENIESRALKTLIWERYKKSFLAESMSKHQLSKSESAPQLRNEKRTILLVPAGGLIIKSKRVDFSLHSPIDGQDFSPTKKETKPRNRIAKAREDEKNNDLQRRHSDAGITEPSESDTPASPSPQRVDSSRRHSITVLSPTGEFLPKSSGNRPTTAERNSFGRREVNEQELSTPDSLSELSVRHGRIAPLDQNDGRLHRDHTTSSLSPREQSEQKPPMAISRSKTFTLLPSMEMEGQPKGGPPPQDHLFSDTPGGHGERRKSIRVKGAELPSVAKPTPTAASTIWNPVHGVCQPFSVIGFLMEKKNDHPSTAKNKKSSADHSRKSAAARTDQNQAVVTAFRVFGKYKDLGEAMDLFRQICAVETIAPADKDTSRFAIYKEDEMTMVLQNYFAGTGTGAYQFKAGDWLVGTGQRFACVGIVMERLPIKLVESVGVYVYQCFPTPQSAVHFAKQATNASLATPTLHVVPLFEWIPLSDIDKFDARNAELEQALESVTHTSSNTYSSTWKARKDALKKPRTLINVVLNIYDLSEANEYILALGLGLFHTGVEIAGDEYSFASGAGIFTCPPRQAGGAKFRESIVMGEFDGSSQEARKLAFSLQPEFEGSSYNLFTKNCNSYSEALCQLLLNTSIPAYINRAAYLGSFLSCLMPSDLSEQAPVGDGSSNAVARHAPTYSAFAGSGQTVGGTSTTTSSNTTLEDRREKVRLAALRRFDQGATEDKESLGLHALIASHNGSVTASTLVRDELVHISTPRTQNSARSLMGKAPSPLKKAVTTLSRNVASNGRESTRQSSFEDAAVERTDRVESTIVSRENATHIAFARSRKADFVYDPTPQYMRILDDYCNLEGDANANSSLLVVVGQSGSGKSALLAHWADSRRRCAQGADEFIYEHYCGCSYDSVKLSLFLFRFINQIKLSYGLRDFELPHEHEEEKLKFSLGRCLEAAVGRSTHRTSSTSKRKNIILVLDGIDCIRTEDGGDSLSWLPNSFPPGVRIIVSATQPGARERSSLHCCKSIVRKPVAYDSEADLIYDTTLPPNPHDSHTMRELRRRNATFIVVEPLDEAACRSIVSLYESRNKITIDSEEFSMIINSPGSSNPLYIRLILQAIDLFGPGQHKARRQWLEKATQTSDLHAIYVLLIRQWNSILLSDLESHMRKIHEAQTLAANGVHISSTSTQNPGLSSSEDRKQGRRTSRFESGDASGSVGMPTKAAQGRSQSVSLTAPPVVDAAELENLQAEIEQRALLLRHTLSLLAVSRYGIAESDFQKLFGDIVPKATCQLVLKLLGPHLMQIHRQDCGTQHNETVVLYDISHNHLRLIVRFGFLRDDQLRVCYYKELATYYQGMEACQRRVDELPVQLERCNMWSALQSILVDIQMFQLWWSERNRQEYLSYWIVLRNNCSIHDPVDDFVRSMDEYIIRESPSGEHLLELFLTITDFLRTWQKVDDSKSGHLTLHRPEPPQLQEFITSLGGFPTAHLSESENRRNQNELDALCPHEDDGYFVRRWLWTQFPLFAVSFECRFLRPVMTKLPSNDASNAADEPHSQDPATSSSSSASFPSPSSSVNGAAGANRGANAKGGATSNNSLGGAASNGNGNLFPKSVFGVMKLKSNAVKRKAQQKAQGSPTVMSSGFDSIPEEEFGAFEFLSAENSESFLSSVSKLEAQLVDLRTKYDKIKFAVKEKSDLLKAVDSRLSDLRAQARAAGHNVSQMEDLSDQIHHVNDETMLGRQRSDYYKAILRHCELHPARDPNAIESAEITVNKLKEDIVDVQQKTQVISYDKRLAAVEVPRLLEVIEEKSRMHQMALSRLRWRQELNIRLLRSNYPPRRDVFINTTAQDASVSAASPVEPSAEEGATEQGKPAAKLHKTTTSSTLSIGNSTVRLYGDTQRQQARDKDELTFSRAKDKLLHKKETSLERMKKAETLQMYVGSAFKDDGYLGALRHVGINKPEEAQLYWQDKLDHAVQLEAEEKQGEQRVSELRDKVTSLQNQLMNLKLGGTDIAVAAVQSSNAPNGSAAGASAAGEGVSKAHNIKIIDQQLAEVSALAQQKKERQIRLKVLSEKLHLGLLHVAHTLGVADAQTMDSLALVDAVEQLVRMFLGDEANMQSNSNNNLRRKNSVRTMGVVSTQSGSHAYIPPDSRTADEKVRYNIRVSKARRQMNPYRERDSDDSGDEQQDQNSRASASHPADGAGGDDSEEPVQRRNDIKNRSKLEIDKQRNAQRRAEKKK